MKKSYGNLIKLNDDEMGDLDNKKSLKHLRKQFTSNIESYIAEIEQIYAKKGLKKDQPLNDEDDDFFREAQDI
jgi:hypothetical protein